MNEDENLSEQVSETKAEVKQDAANRGGRTLFQGLAAACVSALGVYVTAMLQPDFETDLVHGGLLMAMVVLTTGAAYVQRRFGK